MTRKHALLALAPLAVALLSLATIIWSGRTSQRHFGASLAVAGRPSEAEESGGAEQPDGTTQPGVAEVPSGAEEPSGSERRVEPKRMVEIVVPKRSTLADVTDTLTAHGLVGWAWGFRTLAKLRGDDRHLKYGTYNIREGTSWGRMLDRLTRGEVVTVAIRIPEGATLPLLAGIISTVTVEDSAAVAATLADPELAERTGMPVPGVEGYLFPDTYHFAEGIATDEVVRVMWERQREVWTEARLERLDTLGMTQHQVLTLASIVEAEASRRDEMPRIASVYHNRLEDGWPLQADPTILYALGGWRPRLLYAAMDSVADHPYNTYKRKGLPPGPIGSPGLDAIDASLWPADEPFMFFVAGRNGYHEFSRTLAEHNQAIARIRNRNTETATGNQPG